MKNALWLPILALIAVGCSPAKTENPSASPAASPAGAAASPGASPSAAVAEVPEALKHDAFYYYGLSKPRTVAMQLKQGASGPVITGGVEYAVKEVKPDSVVYTAKYTGGLEAQFGTQEISLQADGIKPVSTTIGELKRAGLELPAKLTPGATWDSSSEIVVTGGTTVKQSVRMKVVGPKKVKVGGQELDALEVTGNGTSETGGQKSTLTTRTYFVRDRGAVRMEITVKPTGGAANTLVLEETAS